MKKAVILRVAGNELANQLWNYASIYAYARERGYTVVNPSFFEYGEYFTMQPSPHSLFRLAFFLPFKNYTGRKTTRRRRIWRKIYKWYAQFTERRHSSQVISSNGTGNIPFYLPPSAPANERLTALERGNGNIYFDGWLFRNPLGIKKYRRKIREYFKPRNDIAIRIEETVKGLRKTYPRLIGVHIRQGDYLTWRNGAYFIPQGRVQEIIEEYLKVEEEKPDEVCFIITSDGPIEKSVFKGLNTFISSENAVHDLFLLASTDTIIGSNSTFGAFASYLGNIPLIVMQKEKMDWEYYRDKRGFFENKYSTFVFY